MTDFKLKYQILADAAKAKAEVKSFDDLLKQGGGSLGSAFAGPAAIATAGIAAIGAATVTTGVALFNLTKNAADYGSTIYDASKKTGLHAESLSAMDFAAKQSGTSLEQITGGIAKFSKTVGEAADGSDKAAAKLKDLGITPQEAINDLDGALGKVFQRIIAAPPGIERMTLAQKAFGKSGADLLPFIDSFDGDLGKLIKKAKELGVTIDDKAAKAADDFGDQLDTLNSQLAGVGRTIGTELMPTFTHMASTMSGWLAQNQNEIHAWAETLGTAFSGAASLVGKFAGFVRDNATWIRVGLGVASLGVSEAAIHVGEGLAALTIAEGQKNQGNASFAGGHGFSTGSADALGDIDGKGKGGGKGKKIADKLPGFGSMKSLVISSGNAQWDSWFNQMGQKYGVDPNVLLLQAGGESSFKSGAVSPKGAKGFSQFMPGTAERFGVDTSSVKDSIRGQAEYMSQLLSMFGGDYRKALAGYNAGEGAVQKYGGIPPFRETRAYVSKIQSQYRGRVQKGGASGYGTYDFDADQEAQARQQEELLDRAQGVLDDWIGAEKQASEDRLSIRQEEADRATAILDDYVENGYMTEKEYVERIGELKLGLLEDERAEVAGLQSTKENTQRLAVIDLKIEAQKIKNQTAITAEANKEAAAQKKVTDELREQTAAQAKLIAEYDKKTAADFARRMAETTVGSGQEISAMGELHDYFVGEGNTAAVAGIDATTQALEGMGQALGSVVSAWVLYGAAASSASEMTAQILAGIAQQATVKAVFELAEGFAMLALAFFGHPGAGPSATQHFIAAGIYGGIAGGTALTGRAVAGNSFNKRSGGKGSSASSGYGGGRANQENLRPISRVSDDAYLSGRHDSEARFVARAIEKLTKKIEGMRPGDVVAAGFKQRKGIVATQFNEDIARRPQLGSATLRKMGGR